MKDPDPYAELLLLCAEGDQRAFERLYKKTSPRLFGLCMRMMYVSQLAEEVLQEGYVKIWNNAGSFDPSKASAMTWMTTVVRNRALDVLRRKKVRPVEVESQYEGNEFAELSAGPLDQADLSSATQAVVDCMNGLNEKQKKAILMAYYYGHTHEEISKELNSPLGTVKAWIRRGIERVRACLE